MKKRVIIIAAAVMCIVIFVACLVILKVVLGKKYDFQISTYDYKTYTLNLEQTCKNETERQYGGPVYAAELSEPDSFFEQSVVDNPLYLYSVDEANNRTKTETGKYLFLDGEKYFYISVEDGMIYGTELDLECYLSNKYISDYCHTVIPFIPNNKDLISNSYSGLSSIVDSPVYTWSDVPGINSFEELVDFYKEIDYQIEVESENKTINLPVYSYIWENDANQLCDGYIIISASTDEITLSFGNVS